MQSYNGLNKIYTSGHLDIYYLDLTSLETCPEHITGDFSCRDNNLSSLVGGPQKVDVDYYCSSNSLTDLVGCASHIGGSLRCEYNDITSLVGIHKIIKSCPIIYFDDMRIKEGGIGLLLIENLEWITRSNEPFKIISKYFGTGTKGMMACSKELISRGYTNYAKL